METLVIPARFNGPDGSGNGGYSTGAIAQRLGGRAEVNLRAPVPLDAPLELAPGADGRTEVLHRGAPIGHARPLERVEIEPPAPVTVAEARRAGERYRGLRGGGFSRCFVCGLDRDDSFGVFAGEVEGRDLVASPWVPPAWAADAEGAVRPEFVWAALDCPTYFAAHLGEELTLSVLVREAADVAGRVRAGEEHVVTAWPIEREGRKRLAGSAVFTAGGELLAKAEVLLVEVPSGG